MKKFSKIAFGFILLFGIHLGSSIVYADESVELPGKNVCTVSSDPNKNTGKCIGSFAGDFCYHNVLGSHPACNGNMMIF